MHSYDAYKQDCVCFGFFVAVVVTGIVVFGIRNMPYRDLLHQNPPEKERPVPDQFTLVAVGVLLEIDGRR